MNTTEEIIGKKLAAYLDRRSPPRQIANRPDAQADEIDAIMRTLMRFRPGGNLTEWWQRLEDGLALSCETHAWPLPKQFAKAAEAASRSSMVDVSAERWEPDPIAIAARRMNEGKTVGVHCLYGPMSEALLGAGVSEDTMKRYRSAAFFTRRDMYGEDEAKAWERSMQSVGKSSGKAKPLSELVKRAGAMAETPSRNEQWAMNPDEYMTADEIREASA